MKIIIKLIFAGLLLFTQVLCFSQTEPTQNDVSNAIYKDKDYQKAESMMLQILANHPDSAKAHYLYSQIESKLKKFEVARNALNEAIRLDPSKRFAQNAMQLGALDLEIKNGLSLINLEKTQSIAASNSEHQFKNTDATKTATHSSIENKEIEANNNNSSISIDKNQKTDPNPNASNDSNQAPISKPVATVVVKEKNTAPPSLNSYDLDKNTKYNFDNFFGDLGGFLFKALLFVFAIIPIIICIYLFRKFRLKARLNIKDVDGNRFVRKSGEPYGCVFGNVILSYIIVACIGRTLFLLYDLPHGLLSILFLISLTSILSYTVYSLTILASSLDAGLAYDHERNIIEVPACGRNSESIFDFLSIKYLKAFLGRDEINVDDIKSCTGFTEVSSDTTYSKNGNSTTTFNYYHNLQIITDKNSWKVAYQSRQGYAAAQSLIEEVAGLE